MSDYHHGGVRPECYLCPKSVLDHPEWRIGPDIGLLNYAHRGVRDHYLTILREIVTNYKVDGVELNWFRFGRHFPAGQQREHASILSSWLVEVRGMLDEVASAEGRPRLLLTHIVPATVDESLNLGCDVTAWIKDGLADIVMPSDFLNADFNLCTEQFAQAAKGTNSLIYPMLFPAMAGGIGLVTADNCTAQAANYWKWGADGIATFNMYALGMPWVQRLYPLVESPQAVRAATRHYQFVRATSGSRPIVFDKMNVALRLQLSDGRNERRCGDRRHFELADLRSDQFGKRRIRVRPERRGHSFRPDRRETATWRRDGRAQGVGARRS